MQPQLMLLGFHRAVGRFLGQTPMDLGQAMRFAVGNQDQGDLVKLLRWEFKDVGGGEDDLDQELPTSERYFALFEALNWGVSLDHRLTRDWPFEGISFGGYWCDEFAGGDLVRAFRYARNAVHHDWSLALDVDPIEMMLQQRVELLWLCWVPGLRSGRPDGPGAQAYREYLGGRVAGDTLLEIGAVLEAGTRLVVGEQLSSDEGPARVKVREDDRYVPPRDCDY